MQGMCHLSKPMSASRPETHFYKVRHVTANSVRTLALVQGNKKTPSSKCGYRKKKKKTTFSLPLQSAFFFKDAQTFAWIVFLPRSIPTGSLRIRG